MSNSPTLPSLITRILSESAMVFILWAIVKTVQLLNDSLSVCYIVTSVWLSILDVASSKSMILDFFKNALAIQISYFSPADKLSPPELILVSSPSLFSKLFNKSTLFNTSSNSLSFRYSKGSKFLRRESSNKVGP